jgi:hypothetical protein
MQLHLFKPNSMHTSTVEGLASINVAVSIDCVDILLPNSSSTAINTAKDKAGVELQMHALLTDPQGLIRYPNGAWAQFKDQLWQHTCLECFIGLNQQQYIELNFSPSHEYAHYRFESYRSTPQSLHWDKPIQQLNTQSQVVEWRLRQLIPFDAIDWIDINVSMVVELHNGDKGYFALRHPAEKPDFHDRRLWVAPSIWMNGT